MRIVIELEDAGDIPEVVLRSGKRTGPITGPIAGPIAGPTTALHVGDAIDAGAAPSTETSTAAATARDMITTPMVSTPMEVGSAQSAGAAPDVNPAA